MTLETERLILRPWKDEDAGALYKYASDERVGPPAGWAPHISVLNSCEIIHLVLSREGTFAVVLKETMEPIGSVGIMNKGQGSADMTENEAEIGYWIGVPYWGQGLIPEAVREILRYAFEDLHLETIWCGYFDGNLKSKRVQEKCGFQYQYTKEKVPCSMLNEVRTEHISCLTKERFDKTASVKLHSK